MKVRICGRWEMELEERNGEEPWFLDWVLRSPKQAGIHLTASWHVLKAVHKHLGPVRSAHEYFGGLGAQALMIEELFHPDTHIVQDYAAEAVEFIARQVPEYVSVRQADSYDLSNGTEAELAVLDFGDLTIRKMQPGDPRRALLDAVFTTHPRAVVLTDIAARYLHLHRQGYEAILGEGSCADYNAYLRAVARWVEDTYGYRLLYGCYHHWSTVMAFVPEDANPRLVKTPESPLGISVVRPSPQTAARLEDLTELADWRVPFHEAAQRVGMDAPGLRRWLTKKGENDLLKQLTTNSHHRGLTSEGERL